MPEESSSGAAVGTIEFRPGETWVVVGLDLDEVKASFSTWLDEITIHFEAKVRIKCNGGWKNGVRRLSITLNYADERGSGEGCILSAPFSGPVGNQLTFSGIADLLTMAVLEGLDNIYPARQFVDQTDIDFTQNYFNARKPVAPDEGEWKDGVDPCAE